MRTKQTLIIAALTALFGGVALADTNANTNIHFRFDSAELSPFANQTLCSTVKAAKAHPDQNIVLDGHTDPIGASDYNVGLSLRRAEAVRDKLVAMGISGDRIVISSFGKEEATGNNQADRRVAVKLSSEAIASIVDETFDKNGTSVTWGTPMTTAQLETPASGNRVAGR